MTKKVHLIGIGGEGLYYLALYLHYLGWQVSGSDIKKSERTKRLIKLGIKVFIGHKTSNLDQDLDLVVVSPAVAKDVNEVKAAKDQGLKIYSYRQALDWVFSKLEKDDLTPRQEQALRKSNFAPFYFLDFGRTKLIGVTGTDGKTTTSSMTHHLLVKSGIKAGLVSTVIAKMGNQEMETGLHVTTPSAQELAPLLEKMLAEEPEVLVLEITSHGLAHHRIGGLELDIGVYTNISHEHLDFHQTWEKYVADKAKMINMIKPNGQIVLNRDDRSFKLLRDKAEQEKTNFLTYGHKDSDLVLNQTETREQELAAIVKYKGKEYNLSLPIQGEYNLYNAAGALLAVDGLGLDISQAISQFKSFKLPKGRMEIIQKNPFWVIVDFAHTPNALKNVLSSVRHLVGKKGRLIAVFGAAGQRDKYKRKEMGKIAARLAEVIVLVPEDPRKEKTKDINGQIESGIRAVDKKVKIKRFDKDEIASRKKGIQWAINQAKPGDVVITCGKGHEQSLCFGNKEYPWDEIKVVKKALTFSS